MCQGVVTRTAAFLNIFIAVVVIVLVRYFHGESNGSGVFFLIKWKTVIGGSRLIWTTFSGIEPCIDWVCNVFLFHDRPQSAPEVQCCKASKIAEIKFVEAIIKNALVLQGYI